MFPAIRLTKAFFGSTHLDETDGGKHEHCLLMLICLTTLGAAAVAVAETAFAAVAAGSFAVVAGPADAAVSAAGAAVVAALAAGGGEQEH